MEVISNEELERKEASSKESTSELQKAVIRNPFIWLLAFSSSFMYISRYGINGWGVLFLQEVKGFSLSHATQIISINALLGIVGTVFQAGYQIGCFMAKEDCWLFCLVCLIHCLFVYFCFQEIASLSIF